jgi:hypothetical protein
MNVPQAQAALIAQAQSSQLVARYIALRRSHVERAVAQTIRTATTK